VNLRTVGCADPRLTAPARCPMDKPGKRLRARIPRPPQASGTADRAPPRFDLLLNLAELRLELLKPAHQPGQIVGDRVIEEACAQTSPFLADRQPPTAFWDRGR
jgi:hypothetical protein